MKCPKCGEEIANDSVFCEYCGAKVNKPQSNNTLLKVLVLAVVLCVVCIIGIITYYQNQQHTMQSELSEHQETEEETVVEEVDDSHAQTEAEQTSAKVEEKTIAEAPAFKAGETWSYTEYSSEGNISTYFVFTSKTDVVWLFGTPFGNVFPVGLGKFNESTGDLTFSASNKLHKKISLYYRGDNVFHINPSKKTATYKGTKEFLSQFYNGGNVFSLSKENRNLIPNRKLIGSTWRFSTEDGEYELFFKTSNEVILRGSEDGDESMLYVCIGNMISIKSGDNVDDENLIGNINNGNEVTLCREGLDPKRGSWCGTFYKE